MFCVYSGAGLINVLLTMRLSQKVEVKKVVQELNEEEVGMLESEEGEEVEVKVSKGALNLSPETKKKVWLLSGLFGVDNLSGGLVPVSVILALFRVLRRKLNLKFHNPAQSLFISLLQNSTSTKELSGLLFSSPHSSPLFQISQLAHWLEESETSKRWR